MGGDSCDELEEKLNEAWEKVNPLDPVEKNIKLATFPSISRTMPNACPMQSSCWRDSGAQWPVGCLSGKWAAPGRSVRAQSPRTTDTAQVSVIAIALVSAAMCGCAGVIAHRHRSGAAGDDVGTDNDLAEPMISLSLHSDKAASEQTHFDV